MSEARPVDAAIFLAKVARGVQGDANFHDDVRSAMTVLEAHFAESDRDIPAPKTRGAIPLQK